MLRLLGGAAWWGFPGIGYLERQENRPRLLNIENSKHILVENIILKNSPYWTFWAHGVEYLEVRHVDIDARRDKDDGHDVIDLTAFNTDGTFQIPPGAPQKLRRNIELGDEGGSDLRCRLFLDGTL